MKTKQDNSYTEKQDKRDRSRSNQARRQSRALRIGRKIKQAVRSNSQN